MEVHKSKIGLLGITQELYDDVVEDITEYQNRFGRELVDWFADDISIVYPGPARNRREIEEILGQFNADGLDGTMLVMLTYAPSLTAARAIEESNLPLLLANLQPERTVTADWDMASLTHNQGIHGMQDMANCIMKLGVRPSILSGDWKSPGFRERLVAWATAARTVRRLRGARIATFGQMPGMGDITGDPNDIRRVIGAQIDHAGAGEILSRMQAADDKTVDAAMEHDRSAFDVAPDLPPERHRYAATMYVAIKEFLETNSYDGFCVHFDALGKDGRFEQIHMLAASNLMAEGYGYAAEGDVLCATLMVAGHTLSPDAHFTEMYAMDFERNAVLMSHMGEGNWKVARRDRKPRLINRELRIGGLSNPPTVLFAAQPGPVTLASLANLSGGRFRLVVTEGTVLDEIDLPNIEMPCFFIRPIDGSVEDLATGWLENAGTHHQVMHLGHIADRWRYLAQILGIEFALL